MAELNDVEEGMAFNTIIHKLHDLQVTIKEIRLEQESLGTQVAEAKHQTQMLCHNQEIKTLPTLEHIKNTMHGSGTAGLVDRILLLEKEIKLLNGYLLHKKWIRAVLLVFGLDIILNVFLFFMLRDLWRVLVR